jgi:hypothetical protein
VRPRTGRFEVGGRASEERRAVELQAIIEAHVELVLGAAQASIESGWIDERYSPLGRDRHMAACAARIARRQRSGPTGPVDAAIVAGRHLLTIEAVADEYFRRDTPKTRLARALAALGALAGGGSDNDNAGGITR